VKLSNVIETVEKSKSKKTEKIETIEFRLIWRRSAGKELKYDLFSVSTGHLMTTDLTSE